MDAVVTCFMLSAKSLLVLQSYRFLNPVDALFIEHVAAQRNFVATRRKWLNRFGKKSATVATLSVKLGLLEMLVLKA